MSRSFAKLLLDGFKSIFMKNNRYENYNSLQMKMTLLIFTIGSINHLSYAIATSKNEKMEIVKKYTMVRNGFTEFMVIDEKGRHFNINNSLWYWKWNSIEDWYKISEGDKLYFKYYGWRYPLLGLFPNIYYTELECKYTIK